MIFVSLWKSFPQGYFTNYPDLLHGCFIFWRYNRGNLLRGCFKFYFIVISATTKKPALGLVVQGLMTVPPSGGTLVVFGHLSDIIRTSIGHFHLCLSDFYRTKSGHLSDKKGAARGTRSAPKKEIVPFLFLAGCPAEGAMAVDGSERPLSWVDGSASTITNRVKSTLKRFKGLYFAKVITSPANSPTPASEFQPS